MFNEVVVVNIKTQRSAFDSPFLPQTKNYKIFTTTYRKAAN